MTKISKTKNTASAKPWRVGRSSAGLGLFANQDFKKGDLIIEYTGERITDAEAQRRGGKYLFELNDEWNIDGKDYANIARYLNHSCRPNCEPQLSEDETQVFIYAKKNIKTGEELTYNYGKVYFEVLLSDGRCRCAHCLSKQA